METSKNATAAIDTSWKEQKAKIKAKYPTVTDADLHFEKGKKQEMFKALQLKLKVSREEFSKVISA